MAQDSAHTIVIVGGVAGGASAAARARRCNEHAQIIMFERDEHVSFANCGLPYYIGGDIQDRSKLLVASPRLFRDRFNIDVRTRLEVTSIDRARRRAGVVNRESGASFEQPYDKLILAPGASPILPPIEGIDAPNVFSLRNLQDTDRVKNFLEDREVRRVVVVGAGFIGLEMVEMFRKLQMSVSLVERSPQVLIPLDVEMARMVERELRKEGVGLYLDNGLEGFELEAKAVRKVRLQDGTALDADVVFIGIGVRPNTKLAADAGLELGPGGGIRVDEHLRTSDPDIYAVGDAVEYTHTVADMPMRIPLAGPANRAGRLAGEHAATGSARPMAPVLGTAIVRVFGVTAAVTGCNTHCVRQLNGSARSVWVRAPHHAGYYPGAQAMTIKLLYQPEDQKLLGAQIVGGAGVDKRIDVIATAIQMGATVQDLTDLDLAYAPPFGSAKDPVHMAGFAATNELGGLVRFLEPGADLSGHQVVDVRTDKEVARDPIPGLPHARHIPLDALRRRVGELDPERPTVTVCASGLRSYIAARMLSLLGFSDVADLGGGVLMRTIQLENRP